MLAGAGLLGGCATTQPPASLPGDAGRGRVGRLAVQVAGDSARSFSASFELEGSAAQGQLTLFSPIGLPLGRAQWRPGEAQLDSGAQTQRFGHLDTMMEALVGEALPLAALFDWLEGRPWPDEASHPLAEADGPGFRQLGWKVRTDRLPDGLLVAERRLPEPALTVRIRLDTPS
ncbi:MAG: hypothetical protein RL654_3120 [Pseudomonadota bacterium]